MYQRLKEEQSVRLQLPNQEATETLARCLARLIRKGDIILLSGPMGVGKTTFAQKLVSHLTDVSNITSAAYPLVTQLVTKTKGPLWFCDFFRLKSPHELHEIGISDILADEDAIIVVEWPDVLRGEIALEGCLDLHFSYHEAAEQERYVVVIPSASWPRKRFQKCIVGKKHSGVSS